MRHKPLVTDIARNEGMYMRYLYSRTNRMFEWAGLPDTVSPRYLEYYLQRTGKACITKAHGDYYAFFFNWGGQRDAYYQPKTGLINNPWLDFNVEVSFEDEAVLIRNDAMIQGLHGLFTRYAELLAQGDLTLRQDLVLRRGKLVLASGDDDTRASVRQFISNLEQGKLEPVLSDDLLETLTITPGMDGGNPTYDMELRQYVLASLYNELGLRQQQNNKREYVNERQVATDAHTTLIDDMLYERQHACKELNNRFGWEVSVDFAGEWKREVEREEGELNELGSGPSTTAGSTSGATDGGESDNSPDEADDTSRAKRESG